MSAKWASVFRPPADASLLKIQEYRHEMARKLSALGVGHGDEFVIVNAREFNRHLIDDRQLGPFAQNSETSRKAALDAYPRQGSQRERILCAFAAQPRPHKNLPPVGFTRDALEGVVQLSGNTIRPRVQELIEGGFLEETDRTHRTRSGSEATVLALTKRGEEEVRLRESE